MYLVAGILRVLSNALNIKMPLYSSTHCSMLLLGAAIEVRRAVPPSQ
jgi:hypothetical protein